jgi:hypothetical protein
MPDYRVVKYCHSNGSVEDLSFQTCYGQNYQNAADRANSLMREDPGGRLETDSETKSYLQNYGMLSGSR